MLISLPIASTTRSAHGEAEPPAAHAVRLAERVGRDTLFDHAGLGQQERVPAAPHHLAVRLVAEDGDVAPPHEVRQPSQILPVATPPVGLWGLLRKMAFGCGSFVRNRSTSSSRGRNRSLRANQQPSAPLGGRYWAKVREGGG